MEGAPGFLRPTHDDKTVMDGAPGWVGEVEAVYPGLKPRAVAGMDTAG